MPSPFASLFALPRFALPPEFSDRTSLLLHLGVSQAELKKIWWYRERMYHHFDISKSPGKTRLISAPNYRLKMLQRKIAYSLSKVYRPRNPVHGFSIERSVKTNAQTHLSRRYILNTDLKDFFPTISEGRVRGLFLSLGIDPDVSRILARITCNQGCLPQGAPSSPIISNMICFRLDKALMEYAKNHRLLYTRYADDITLSSFQPLSLVFDGARPSSGKVPAESLSKELTKIIEKNGFELNAEKVHYADKNSRRIVTGIKVNEGLNVDRRYVRNIRAALYKIEKSGIAAAQVELNSRFGRNCSLQAHLQGKISWIGFVKGQADPVFRGLAIRYNSNFLSSPIKVHPTSEQIRERAVWVLEQPDDDPDKGNQGTAFFLKGIGLITAAHCVDGSGIIKLFHPSKTSNAFTATVAHSCIHRDLAILDHSIPSNEFFELEPETSPPSTGAHTTAVGYPNYGPGDKLNVRSGTISSLTVKNAMKLVEVTQMLSQGMSGGPLLSDADKVLGIVHKGGPGEPRNFAVDVAELNTWIATLL